MAKAIKLVETKAVTIGAKIELNREELDVFKNVLGAALAHEGCGLMLLYGYGIINKPLQHTLLAQQLLKELS
jgi:hypothetical protein